MIGATFAAAAPGIPSWLTGFQASSNVGGLLAAVLAPAGGFGKFLMVLIALSTSSACAPTIYTFGEPIITSLHLDTAVPTLSFVMLLDLILLVL